MTSQRHPPWEPSEDKILLQMRLDGETFVAIARRLGRRTKLACVSRHEKLISLELRDPGPPITVVHRELYEADDDEHVERLWKDGGFPRWSERPDKRGRPMLCPPLIWERGP